jgi:hypothetical protein
MDYTTILRRGFLWKSMGSMPALPPKFDIQLGWPVSHRSGMLGHMAQHAASAESMCRACPWRTMPDRTVYITRAPSVHYIVPHSWPVVINH